MSRIGKKEIPLPKGVEVRQDGGAVVVKGPKGSLSTPIIPGISDVGGEQRREVRAARTKRARPARSTA